ncbi:MAG: phosphate regulon sensor histidine kinase PhoR [Sulfuritalea sp.]|nr:phosphate regulon sensor histidine kinase PhoR [Sulfuritalea sp.]
MTSRVLWRIFTFTLVQILGAILGYWLDERYTPSLASPFIAALVGAVIAGYVWHVLDLSNGLKVLRWLRHGDSELGGVGSGVWSEVGDRVRRLVRTHQRSVAQSEERLQDFLAALQASPNGIVLLDSQNRIEWFNQTASSHFGFEPRRDLLQHFGNLVRDPGFAAYFSANDFQGGVVMPGRANTLTKPVRLSVHIHPYGGGRSLLLSRDITALEQAEAMRRDFVANVSHEIRTPLTVLSGFVETLQSLPLNEAERERYLALMAQQAMRMQSLVSDLLTLSRLEGSPLPPTHEWVNVTEILGQCKNEGHELSRVLWNQAPLLVFEVQSGIEIAGYGLELHSAFFNLIGNAIRYTPSDKEIRVSWKVQSDGSALFSVKDQGVGIALEHIGRLTERFYRVDRSRSRDTGGTGLGLAIVKHVAQRHSAELTISSKLGEGSTFTIRFAPARVKNPV